MDGFRGAHTAPKNFGNGEVQYRTRLGMGNIVSTFPQDFIELWNRLFHRI
jgi:hypothetical protein